VRRIIGRLLHNWPLKLAAVVLATLMYGGLAVSQNTQAFSGVIPVRVENQPTGTVLLTRPDPVILVRYYAAPDVPVATSSFRATVDLNDVAATGDVASVRIEVDSPDDRVRVLSFEPTFATVQLDKLVTARVRVKVDPGPAPSGLELGPTEVEPTEVTASGAASIVSQVVWARADVQIGTDGINIDQEFELTPIDGNGNAVSPVDLDPSTAHVTIPVFDDKSQKTLPVNPVVTGTPAAGFEIASITVKPDVVTVQGDLDQLASMSLVDTLPVPVTGASSPELSETVKLDLPTGILPVGDESVVVAIKLRPVTSTRTFTAGLRLVGTRSDLTYEVAVKSVLLTIGGSTAGLDLLSGATITAELDVTGLGPGATDVSVSAPPNLPGTTTLVAASPSVVKVTITGSPITSPSPGASTSPVPSGSATPSASPTSR
jgi:YbbR domain-containing protein